MTVDDFKRDLSERLGQKVSQLLTRDGEAVEELSDLYQASPAGFGGRLVTTDGRQAAWELWLEDEDTWNFQATPLNQETP